MAYISKITPLGSSESYDLKAAKLVTARSLKTKLDSTTAVTFDGSADQNEIPVTGTLPVGNGGTGNTSFTSGRMIYASSATKLSGTPYMHFSYTAGTTSTVGQEDLVIGNTTASGTANNAYGMLSLYSQGTKGTQLISATNSTDWYTATLQAKTGTIALMDDIAWSSIGSALPDAAELNNYNKTNNSLGLYYSGSSTKSATLSHPPFTSSGFRFISLAGYGNTRGHQIAWGTSVTPYLRTETGTAGSYTAWSKLVYIQNDSNNANVAIGSSSQPVYANSDGKLIAATAYSDLLTSFTSSTNTLSITVGGTTKTASAINSVSNTWTAGTTAGPTIKTTVNGVAGTAVAIPSASKTASGVVTTGSQNFLGRKGFGQLNFYGYNDTGTSTQYAVDIYGYTNAGTLVNNFWYDHGNATNITKGQWYFAEYSPNSTADTSTTGKRENYYLPNVTSGLTSNVSYAILTSKNAVTIAQGGTSATTAGAAANNLLSGLPAWTANPTDDTYFIRRDTAGSATFGQVKASTIYNYIKGKTDSVYAPISHNHYQLVTEGDNRTTATTPNSYNNNLVFRGLKTNSSFGSPSADTYSYVVGLRGWQDSSGGNAYELAFNNSGIYFRNGATTSWNSWNQFVTEISSLTSLGSGTPAAATKTYWVDNIPNNTVRMGYNTSGTEYTLLFSRGGSVNYGSILKWGYNDKYIYTLRKYGDSWKADDWEKISAGYADSAASATTATKASYLKIVASNEIRLDVDTKPSSAITLCWSWAWSDGSKDAKINRHNFYNGNGALAEIQGSKVYGAVWNDYAEYRITRDTIEPGRCVIETGNDDLVLSTKRLQPGAEIVSDTFGFAIGETDEAKTPIASNGRVLAYIYEGREAALAAIGKPVCSGPDGTVSIMTDEEYQKYGYCAIGTISAVPDYEKWGTGNIKVNNRIWIRIR